MKAKLAFLVLVSSFLLDPSSLPAFEGQITSTLTRGGETQTWLYTVGTNALHIQRAETNWPHARNIVALDTGAVTLVFPHNRSFVRLKPAAASSSPSAPPGFPSMPAPPPGRGPQSLPAGLPPGVGPQAGGTPGFAAGPRMSAGLPAMPMAPMMPMGMMEKAELKATGDKTNLLGFACEKFELKQRGDVMEIWATDQLLPFYAWLANQPPRLRPRMLEEQWGELLKAKKLFPLRAVLRFENGPERMRFEVTSIKPEQTKDSDGLFQPPPHYHEMQPLPF